MSVTTKEIIKYILILRSGQSLPYIQLQNDKLLLIILKRIQNKNCFKAVEFVINYPNYTIESSFGGVCAVTNKPTEHCLELSYKENKITINESCLQFLLAFRDFAYFPLFVNDNKSNWECYKRYVELNEFIQVLLNKND